MDLWLESEPHSTLPNSLLSYSLTLKKNLVGWLVDGGFGGREERTRGL